MFSDENTWTRFFKTLYEVDGYGTAYVYRVDVNMRAIKPFLRRYQVNKELVENIRNDFGGGDYWVMMRDGRILVFSGGLGIADRINQSRHV